MSDFSESLIRLRKQDGLTQEQLAKALGMAKSSISMYENGKRIPSFEVAEAMADFFNVNMDELCGRDKPAFSLYGTPDNIIPMPQMNTVPLVGTIACGDPILAEENIEDYIGMPEHVRADFALRCKGDSMIGARIHDGDIVYIKQDAYVNNGDIAAVLIDDEATLKRIYRNEGSVVLQPENPAYAPLVFAGSELETLRLLGKAVAFTSVVK